MSTPGDSDKSILNLVVEHMNHFGIFLILIAVYALFSLIIGGFLVFEHGVFLSSMAVLVVCLIGLHGTCWLLSKRLTKNIPKLMDYGYLMLAIFGIAGAVEIDYHRFLNFARALEPHINETVSYIRDTTDLNAKFICEENANYKEGGYSAPQLCTFYRDINKLANSPIIQKNWKATISHYGDEFKVSAPVDVENIVKSMSELLNSRKEYKRLMRLSQTTQFWSQSGTVTIFSYFFIAAAIALRITKVSVELNEWWSKK